MDLSGCGQESRHDALVHLDRRLRHDVANRLDFLLEFSELLVDHRAENALDLRLLQQTARETSPGSLTGTGVSIH